MTEHNRIEHNQEEQIITAIEAQRRPGRYNLSINGEYAFSVHEDIVVKYRLLKGVVITDRLRQDVLAEEEINAAYRSAIRYIGRAMRSSQEVRVKLKDKGYNEASINVVIQRLVEQRYIDDEVYASALARQRIRSNKKGPLWVRRELSQKGIDQTSVEQAMTQFNKSDEYDQALELASKRWRSIKGELPDRIRKIMSLLQRRGYTSDTIRKVTQQLRINNTDESTDWEDQELLET